MAELPLEVEIQPAVPSPVYQRIAAQAAEMCDRGGTFDAIAEHFGVDDHTAAKAVRWFRLRPVFGLPATCSRSARLASPYGFPTGTR